MRIGLGAASWFRGLFRFQRRLSFLAILFFVAFSNLPLHGVLSFSTTSVAQAASPAAAKLKIKAKAGAVPVPASGAPLGWFDGANSCALSGWAIDPQTNLPADVHFYANAPAGQGGVLIGYAHANKSRADVVERYEGYKGNPGFTAVCSEAQNKLIASSVEFAASTSSRPPSVLVAGAFSTSNVQPGSKVFAYAVSNNGALSTELRNSPQTIGFAAGQSGNTTGDAGTNGCYGNGFAELGDPGIYIGPDGKINIDGRTVQAIQDPNDKGSVYYIDTKGKRYNFAITALGNYDTVSNIPPKSCMKILGDVPPTPDENGQYSEPQKAWLVFRDNKPTGVDEKNWEVYYKVQCKCAADTGGRWVLLSGPCSKGQKCIFVTGAGEAKTRSAYKDGKGTHFSINDKCIFNIPTPGEQDKDYCVRDNPYDAGGPNE